MVEASAYGELIVYDEKGSTAHKIDDFSRLRDISAMPGIKWLSVVSQNDVEAVESICLQFGIHFLTLEDIVDRQKRPKIDEFEKYVFLILQSILPAKDPNLWLTQQISLVVCEGMLITFQEQPSEVFDQVKIRIQSNQDRIRNKGADYLTYIIIDELIERISSIVEAIEDRAADLEKAALNTSKSSILDQISQHKSNVAYLKRAVSPLREITEGLQKIDSKLFSKALFPYLRDLHSHIIQIIDSVRLLSDSLTLIITLNMTSISNRLNNIMKVLTIISSIFIPLTFIAGVYGMNFDNMPELRWPYGYFTILGVMITTALTLILIFRKKHWI